MDDRLSTNSLQHYVSSRRYNPYHARMRDAIWNFIHHELIISGYAQRLRVIAVPYEEKLVVDISYRSNSNDIKFIINWENKFSVNEFEEQLRAYHMLLKEGLTTS